MVNNRKFAAFALVLGILITNTFPVQAGEIVEHDGHTTIRNNEPALPMVELELEELWRRGGEDDDLMIGLPVEALSDEEGRVYLGSTAADPAWPGRSSMGDSRRCSCCSLRPRRPGRRSGGARAPPGRSCMARLRS